MFIPLHDANSLKHIRMQYVTIGLIVANVLVFALTSLGSETNYDRRRSWPRLHPLDGLRYRRAPAEWSGCRTARSMSPMRSAQRHLPPRRQHAVPVGVRRQCRGRARRPARYLIFYLRNLPSLAPSSMASRSARLAVAADRRLRRDRPG